MMETPRLVQSVLRSPTPHTVQLWSLYFFPFTERGSLSDDGQGTDLLQQNVVMQRLVAVLL